MIKAIKGPRNSCLALCVCDDCLVEVSFDAVHEGGHGENRAIMLQKLALKNPGAVSRRLQAMGWVESGKRLRCKACEAKRKQTADAKTIAAGSANSSGMRELEYQSSRCICAFLPPELAIGAQEI